MTCETLEAKLVQYAGGELSPEQCRDVDDHLRECPACQALVQDLKSTLDLLGGALAGTAETFPTELPESVHDDIVATVFASGGRSRGRDAWLFRPHRALAVAASVMVVLGLSWAVVVSLRPPTRRSAADTRTLSAVVETDPAPAPSDPVGNVEEDAVALDVELEEQEVPDVAADRMAKRREARFAAPARPALPAVGHDAAAAGGPAPTVAPEPPPAPVPEADRQEAALRPETVVAEAERARLEFDAPSRRPRPTPVSRDVKANQAPARSLAAPAVAPASRSTVARAAPEPAGALGDASGALQDTATINGLERPAPFVATETPVEQQARNDLAAAVTPTLPGSDATAVGKSSTEGGLATSRIRGMGTRAAAARLSLTSSCAPSPFRVGRHLFVVHIAAGRRVREGVAVEIAFDGSSVHDVRVLAGESSGPAGANPVRVAVDTLGVGQNADVVCELTIDDASGDAVLATVTATFESDGEPFAQRQRITRDLTTPSFGEAHAAFRVAAMSAELTDISENREPGATARLQAVADLLRGTAARDFQENTVRSLQGQVEAVRRASASP